MSTSSLNRRELLATFLGASAAAVAGCSPSGNLPPLPDGQIVGPSVTTGHRIRDGWSMTPNPDRHRQTSVVIVGGGIAGLAAAWRLRQAGLDDFVLLELEPVVGGTACSGQSAVSAYPWGAHYVPVPLPENRLMVRLFEELGISQGTDADGQLVIAEQFLCREPQERVFFRGRWYEGLYPFLGATEEDLRQWRRFMKHINRWVAWRDGAGRRAFTLPVAACSHDVEVTSLDRICMADWLDQHNFTSTRLRWMVDYACRDDYGSTAEQTSAWAGLFYFTARIPQAGAESQEFVTWPEGNGRLVEQLARPLGQRLQTGMAVLDLAPDDPQKPTGVTVTAVDSQDHAWLYQADQVICAAPQFVAKYLLRPWREQPPQYLQAFQYGSWVVANLSLRDRPPSEGFELSWDNVLYDSPSLGYVVATHQSGHDYGPTVWTWYYPICDADPRTARSKLLGTSWADWAEVALSDLEPAHRQIRTLVERIDVMKWGHAMARPTPGLMWSSDRQAAACPFGPVHFAGSDLSGMGLFEEACYHGVRAAEEVLQQRGQQTISLL